MAHVDIYPTRWATPTVDLTALMVQRRLQALLDANGVERRVRVVFGAITEEYGDNDCPTVAEVPPQTNWADIGLPVRFGYLLDRSWIGSSTHEYEWRLDYLYPVDEDPLWFDDPLAHGVTDEQLTSLKKIPYGWCGEVSNDAEPFILAAFGITVSVLAEHVDGIAEIWDQSLGSTDLFATPGDVAAVWVQDQIKTAEPGDLDPEIRKAWIRREEAAERERLAAEWEAEYQADLNNPDTLLGSIRDKIEAIERKHQWRFDLIEQKIARYMAAHRGLPPGR